MQNNIQTTGLSQAPSMSLPVRQIMARPELDGGVSFCGHAELSLEGDFGDHFRRTLEWAKSVRLPANTSWQIWPELRTEGDVQVRLRCFFWNDGAREAAGSALREDMTKPFYVAAEEDMELAFTLEAVGNGRIHIGPLHLRQTVTGGSVFVRGTQRTVDAGGEELFTCFRSMDRKPPLYVKFSDRRTREGFDGFEELYVRGCPFLVLYDPRLGGGCGYLGTPDYEKMVRQKITGAMGTLGFDNSQVILEGNSLGAAGALYYGASLHPRAMILGRPIVNLGDMALREKLWRPGGFPASLDILQKLEGAAAPENAQHLNQKMQERLENGNLEGTRLVAAYMKEDDYDPSAYMDLLHHLKGKRARVFGKSFEGRHDDGREEVEGWLELQRRRILREFWGR